MKHKREKHIHLNTCISVDFIRRNLEVSPTTNSKKKRLPSNQYLDIIFSCILAHKLTHCLCYGAFASAPQPHKHCQLVNKVSGLPPLLEASVEELMGSVIRSM